MAPPMWLPDDIIWEILLRTPVKSVCRFRCVSKKWLALISEPAFAAAHRCPDFLLVGVSSDPHTSKTSINVMDMDGNVLRVMDGESCFSLSAALDGSSYLDMSSGNVVDFVTGQVIVPCPPELRKRAGVQLFTIGRAGYKYKAVCVSRNLPYIYMILTLGAEDAEWRPMPSPPHDDSMPSCFARSLITLSNGVVYFVLKADNLVICFDLESETWKETIPGPPIADPRSLVYARRLTLLNDALCMVVSLQQSPREFWSRKEVWMMSDHGAWSKMCSIPPNPHLIFIAPLRVIRRDDGGGEQLLASCYEYRATPCVHLLRLYSPLGVVVDETVNVNKLPSNLIGIAGVCSLNLKKALSSSLLPC